MRKAGKKRIAAALRQYDDWRAKVDSRMLSLPPAAQTIATAWANDVRDRITEGELGICTTALARSTVRMIEDFESGFYVGVTPTGGFLIASHQEAV